MNLDIYLSVAVDSVFTFNGLKFYLLGFFTFIIIGLGWTGPQGYAVGLWISPSTETTRRSSGGGAQSLPRLLVACRDEDMYVIIKLWRCRLPQIHIYLRRRCSAALLEEG